LPDFLYALTPELFRRIGVEARLTALPAERALINANSGIDDGDMFRPPGIEEIYPNLIMVPEKLVDFEFIAYSKRPEIKIRNFDDLKPYALGFVRGYKNIESRVTQVREVALVTNTEQLFDLIDNDRVDIIIIGRIGKMVNQEAVAHRLTAHQPALFSTGMHLYLHQKHAALVPRLAQALKGMKADGSYRKIVDATLNRATTP
jgi:polar amino acid transport system substrate-binding protein